MTSDTWLIPVSPQHTSPMGIWRYTWYMVLLDVTFITGKALTQEVTQEPDFSDSLTETTDQVKTIIWAVTGTLLFLLITTLCWCCCCWRKRKRNRRRRQNTSIRSHDAESVRDSHITSDAPYNVSGAVNSNESYPDVHSIPQYNLNMTSDYDLGFSSGFPADIGVEPSPAKPEERWEPAEPPPSYEAVMRQESMENITAPTAPPQDL